MRWFKNLRPSPSPRQPPARNGHGVSALEGGGGAPASSPPMRSGGSSSGSGFGAPYFDALAASPNRAPVPAYIPDAFRFLIEADPAESAARQLMAGIARYLVDSFAPAFSAVDVLSNYASPVIPRANSPDRDWNSDANDLFDEWAATADDRGLFDFVEMQRLISMGMDTDGDLGIVAVPSSLDSLPRLRGIPSWRIGRPYGTTARTASGQPIRDGVILDANERVVGYEVTKGPKDFVALGADQMLLMIEPDRLERIRGLSALRRGMNDLRDWKEIKGLETLATKIESSFPSIIKGCPGGLGTDWDDPDNPPPPSDVPKSVQLAALLGGEIPVMEGEFQQLTSNRPGTNKIEFLDTLVGIFVTGIGIPRAFFLEEKMTGPGWRAVLGKAQRRFNTRQRVLMKLARWTWVRVIGAAVADRLLAPNPAQFRVRHLLPPLVTIDLGDAANAEREAVSRGLMSRQRYHGNAQHEWDDETEQIIAEDEWIISRLKEQAGRLDIPEEILLARHGYTINKIPTPPGSPEGPPVAGTPPPSPATP